MWLKCFGAGITLLTFVSSLDHVTEVAGLRGAPDYRQVSLKWEYPRYGAPLYGFQVHYCELQAWGPNRCKTKVVESSGEMEDVRMPGGSRAYSVVISGLRMSTNYSFTVRPLETRRTRYLADKASTIFLATKGFSAKAILCLPDTSEVEVSTGPHFSGRIAVEGAVGPECGLEGDPNSPQESYVLRIHHSTCRSTANSTAVATFILVQENLPILTHSTRRFLVLCTFQPETLTVRAGLNLPHTSHGSIEPQSESQDGLAELSSNEVHASPLQQDEHSSSRSFKEEKEAQVVLTTVALIAGFVALGLAIWWFIPQRTLAGASVESILSDDSTSSVYDNFENAIRDGSEIPDDVDPALVGTANPVLVDQVLNRGVGSSTLNLERHTVSDA